MSKLHSSGAAVSLASLALLTLGCSSGPSRILPPSIDADDSAERAMELYDSDSDGLLNSAELEKCPGLNAAIETLDTDGDEHVSESEIADRIRSWQATQAGVCSIVCHVKMDGIPLTGATVTFEPESFLGDDIQAALGVTTSYGRIGPSIPKENRPIPDMPPGMQLGIYRIRISKIVDGEETIPAKYNTETTLGQQLAPDDPVVLKQRIVLNLTKK